MTHLAGVVSLLLAIAATTLGLVSLLGSWYWFLGAAWYLLLAGLLIDWRALTDG